MDAHTKLGEVDDPAACRFMSNAIRYLREFGDGVHNERDAVLLRRLQAADPAMRDTCRHLEELRKRLRESESEMQRCIAGVRFGDAELCRRVKLLVAEYCCTYGTHFALEEQEVLPMALDFLAERDWREASEPYANAVDSVFGPEALKRYPTPYDGIMAFQRRSAN